MARGVQSKPQAEGSAQMESRGGGGSRHVKYSVVAFASVTVVTQGLAHHRESGGSC